MSFKKFYNLCILFIKSIKLSDILRAVSDTLTIELPRLTNAIDQQLHTHNRYFQFAQHQLPPLWPNLPLLFLPCQVACRSGELRASIAKPMCTVSHFTFLVSSGVGILPATHSASTVELKV